MKTISLTGKMYSEVLSELLVDELVWFRSGVSPKSCIFGTSALYWLFMALHSFEYEYTETYLKQSIKLN